MRGVLRNGAWAATGYILTVVIASFVCLLVYFLFTPPFPKSLGDFATAYWIGFAMTAMSAWPGFVATLVIARLSGFRSVPHFVFCGMATAMTAVVLYGGILIDSSFIRHMLLDTPAIYVGGLAGGFTYANLARRFGIFIPATGAPVRTGSGRQMRKRHWP
jgi:hypothetical protein